MRSLCTGSPRSTWESMRRSSPGSERSRSFRWVRSVPQPGRVASRLRGLGASPVAPVAGPTIRITAAAHSQMEVITGRRHPQDNWRKGQSVIDRQARPQAGTPDRSSLDRSATV